MASEDTAPPKASGVEVEAMNIISYRLEEKFAAPSSIGEDITNFASAEGDGFNEALETFQGLVLYHGGWDMARDFLTKWEAHLREHRFIVLFFSTDAYVATTEECRALKSELARQDCEAVTGMTDLLPFFHLLTYSVLSPCEDLNIKKRFTALITAFKKLRSLERRYQVNQLWESIDPVSDQVTEKRLLARMRDLEGVIVCGHYDAVKSPESHRKAVSTYYEGESPSYDKLREDYLELCRKFRLKKKLSRWQVERESLNHKDFQHYFYDLIARPTVVNTLDDFSSGRCPELSPAITSVLQKWDSLKSAFSALFLRANPEAVASCELNLALLAPQHRKSAELIQRYKDKFGDEIEVEVRKAQALLDNIDTIIKRLMGQYEGAYGVHLGGLPEALGTELSARCKEFSTHVSSLRHLADIAE